MAKKTPSKSKTITKEMHQQLSELGYSKLLRMTLTPEEALNIINKGKKYTGAIALKIINKGKWYTRSAASKIIDNASNSKRSVNPDKVEKEINRPSKSSVRIKHKIVTEELTKAEEPSIAKKDQVTHRKTRASKARRHLDPNVKVTTDNPTLKERIEKRAYQIWEQEGRVHGKSDEYWLRAKNEFIREEAHNIYEARKNTRFAGSPEHDWIKAERRIERQLKDPLWMDRVSSRKAKIKIALAAKAEREAREAYIKKGYQSLTENVSGLFEKAYTTAKDFYKDRNFSRNTKLFWSKNRWARGAAKGLAATVALNLGIGLMRKVFQGPVIPSEYEKGYDIISSYSTDFGSPLKLSKATHKSLRPYYSTVRRSLRTNVNTVINNSIALSSHKNAIGHMRY